jgi:DNA-binding NtrC family response regulator
MVGRHVLVVAARRATRNGVRGALRTMGLMLDFVASVDEAREFCEHGIPHAIVYEAALAGDRFRRLRATWSAAAPQLAFVEITEHGHARLVSGPGQGCARRDPVADGLGQALADGLVAAV